MQNIFQVGRNYLTVDQSYLPNYIEGQMYDLVLSKKDCTIEYAQAETKTCNGTVQFSFELIRCLQSAGLWRIDIKNVGTDETVHTITNVKVYPLTVPKT